MHSPKPPTRRRAARWLLSCGLALAVALDPLPAQAGAPRAADAFSATAAAGGALLPEVPAVPVPPRVDTVPLAGVDPGELARERQRVPEAAAPLILTAPQPTAPYSALGVTWAADPGLAEVRVQVRTRRGGVWSGWEEVGVEPDAAPDADTAVAGGPGRRLGSDPLYVGPADGVQVRVDAGERKPRDVRLALIDPGTSLADATAGDAEEAAQEAVRGAAQGPAPEAAEDARQDADAARWLPKQPYVRSRARWGADESLRGGDPAYSRTIKGAVIHHSATGNGYSRDEVPAIMRSMYAYHTRSLGWSDLGYNIVIDRFGRVWEGRAGGVDRPVLGTHAGGFNKDTTGVSIIGNYDRVKPSRASVSALERVLAWKLALHGRNAKGKTEYVSGGSSYTFYPAGTKVRANVISGHRDYSTKSCPGRHLYALLPKVRSNVAARMRPPAPTSLTVASPAAATAYGQPVRLSGRLTRRGGSGLGGRTLTVERRSWSDGRWRRVGAVRTEKDGRWRTIVRPPVNSGLRVRFPGAGGLARSTARPSAVLVRATASAALSRRQVRLGQPVQLTGVVAPGIGGRLVTRQFYYRGVWRSAGATRTTAGGRYAFTFVPPGRGIRAVRVLMPGDVHNAPGASAPRYLSVTR